jgi:hypothetical protein
MAVLARYWDQYWAWTGGNIGAMPLQALITAVVIRLLWRPLTRLWTRALGEHPSIKEARAAASAAHQIVADLFEHVTGEAHPQAPPPPGE